jgi:hypothetical protein
MPRVSAGFRIAVKSHNIKGGAALTIPLLACKVSKPPELCLPKDLPKHGRILGISSNKINMARRD